MLSLVFRILAIVLLLLPSLVAVSQPKLMQGCDFVMTFYPAGAMVASGQAANIFPPDGATSFIDAPFNLYTHKLLTFLPQQYVGIFMYSPLVAAVFVPFSKFTTTVALVLWQVLNIAVMLFVSFILAHKDRKKTVDYFIMMALFCPIFHTLLIGQLGIVLGLLPLAVGYFLWRGGRDMAAGFVWGFLGLKPQFLPAALLVAGALLLNRRFKMALGLVLGLAAFAAFSLVILGPEIFSSWIRCLRLADTIFANPAYGFPEYMVVSLPAVLLQSFPHALRASVKLPIYAVAAGIGLYTLWHSVGLLRAATSDVSRARAQSIVMLLGLLVLPLVLPHFLFYDMCGLAFICVLAYENFWSAEEGDKVKGIRLSMWWMCNLFYCGFMFAKVKPLGQWYALFLVLMVALWFCRILRLPKVKEIEPLAD